jgi:FkbM family methyltransferase
MKRLLKHLAFLGILKSIYLYLIFKLKFLKLISIKYKGYKIFMRPKTSDFFVLNQIFADKQYNPYHYVENPKVIIDGGANVGMSSIYFNSLFPEAKIFSFEPDTNNFIMLNRNLGNLKNIKTFQKGLWGKSAKIYLNIISGYVDFYVTEEKTPKTIAEIDCISIADLMTSEQLDSIDILKLDIEGAEKIIFETDPEKWLPKVGCIMIETHDRMTPNSSKALFDALQNYDFHLEVSGETLKFFKLKRK